MDKVLIVDDNLEYLNILKEGLKRYESQFEVVTDLEGKGVLEVLKRVPISVLVMDLAMPKVGGLELLPYMTKNHPQIPCIVMIEPKSSETKKKGGRGNILLYLEKPADLNELAGAIIEGLDLLDEGVFWQEHR